MRAVGFTELGDWSPVGYINQFVWIAFDERLVATGDDSLEVEAHALLEYSQRHGGAAPLVHNWEIDPDRNRPGE